MSQMARRLTLILLCSVALSACSLFNQQQPTPPGDKATTPYPQPEGVTATTAGQAATATSEGAYPAPTTAPGEATAVPGGPTAVPGGPTAVPGGPAQPPAGGGPLVGPEWTVLYSGDLNGDGAADVVAYKPASGVAPGAAFQQAQYANFKGIADTLVVVQANPAGQPYVQLEGTKTLLRSAGNTLTSFTGAAGHMARVNAGQQPQLDIQAVDASGAPIGRMLGLVWDGASGRYVIYTAPAK